MFCCIHHPICQESEVEKSDYNVEGNIVRAKDRLAPAWRNESISKILRRIKMVKYRRPCPDETEFRGFRDYSSRPVGAKRLDRRRKRRCISGTSVPANNPNYVIPIIYHSGALLLGKGQYRRCWHAAGAPASVGQGGKASAPWSG
jgi:hypothetical protein